MKTRKILSFIMCLATLLVMSITFVGCTGVSSYEDNSDGIVGDNDSDGDIDDSDFEDEWSNYLDDAYDAAGV